MRYYKYRNYGILEKNSGNSLNFYKNMFFLVLKKRVFKWAPLFDTSYLEFILLIHHNKFILQSAEKAVSRGCGIYVNTVSNA